MRQPGHKYLEQLTDFGIKLGLDKIRHILFKLGNPQKKFPSILIAGTNGKGSVSSFIAHCLKENNYRVGLYTSPHLIKVEERIQINGKPIPSKVFDSLCLDLRNLCLKLPLEMQPTYFEALTAVAFEYFAEENIDVCVCEVGMGGRFDATNVIDAELEVITPVSYDHMEYLGNSIEEIAAEKAGIIKWNSIVVSGKQLPGAIKVLKRVCKQKKSKLFSYGNEFSAKQVYSNFPEEQRFHFYGREKIKDISIKLFGNHQIHNAAVAIESLLLLRKKGFNIQIDAIRNGMKNTFWPARFQLLMENPLVILDGGHNPAGIKSLKNTLKGYFPDKKFIFLVGILKDKKWDEMLRMLSTCGKRFIFTKVDNPRSMLPEILAEKMKSFAPNASIEIIEEPFYALEKVCSMRDESPRVICGSLYLAGEILKILRTKRFKNLFFNLVSS